MPEEVKHITVNGKYRMVIEQAASTKGVLGYKIESNGDDIGTVEADLEKLMNAAKRLTTMPVMQNMDS